MAKQQKQKPFSYLSASNFDVIEGVYQGFKSNANGVAIVLDTGKELKGVGLNTVLKGLAKSAIENNMFVENQSKVKIEKGKKANGKNYFLSKLFIDGEEIIAQTDFSASEIVNLL